MGWTWTVVLNGLLGIGCYWASRFGLRQSSGLPRILATIVLAWAWLTIGMEALGSIGWLSRIGLLCWVGVGFLAGLGCLLATRGVEEAEIPRLPARPLSREEVLSYGLTLWAVFARGSESLFGPVLAVSDGPIYHLYFAIRWWKAGRLEMIATPFGESAATYFPAGGDLWFTWLVIGWGGDLLAKIGQFPFFALTGMTLFAFARQLGVGRPAVAIAIAWALTGTGLFMFSLTPNVDTIFVAGYLLSAYFFLRHALKADGLASLALGGLAAGCALGTKAPAFVFIVPLLVLGFASAIGRGGTLRSRLLGGLIVFAAPILVAGFWYARNMILTGNPLYPLHVAVFGRVWLAGWYGPEMMRHNSYYLPIEDWRSFLDLVTISMDPRLAPPWLAALLGAWAWRRDRRPGLDGWVWVASALVAINLLLYWLAIPYRSQQRFMFHALALAVIPLARTFDRGVWVRSAAILLLIIHMFTPQSWPFRAGAEFWDLSPKIPNKAPGIIFIPRMRDNPAQTILSFTIFFVVGLASFCVTWLAGRLAAPAGWRRRTFDLLAILIIVPGMLTLTYPWGLDLRHRFFAPFPPLYRGWWDLEGRIGPSSAARIAYTGTNLPYYLMGPNLRNEVRYVNIDGHPSWLMHDYHADALKNGSGPPTWDGPRPGWDRSHPDYRAWLANLRAEGIQLLVTNPADPLEVTRGIDEPTGFPIERRWADAHPEAFQLLYGDNPPDREFRTYRVKSASE
jgi:Dolichyl-phosphate-mannose-protein mannosyltransferase